MNRHVGVEDGADGLEDAGGGDEDVGGAGLGHDARGAVDKTGLVGHVGFDPAGLAAVGHDRRGDGPGADGVGVEDPDERAVAGEPTCAGFAEAAGPSGHDGGFRHGRFLRIAVC